MSEKSPKQGKPTEAAKQTQIVDRAQLALGPLVLFKIRSSLGIGLEWKAPQNHYRLFYMELIDFSAIIWAVLISIVVSKMFTFQGHAVDAIMDVRAYLLVVTVGALILHVLNRVEKISTPLERWIYTIIPLVAIVELVLFTTDEGGFNIAIIRSAGFRGYTLRLLPYFIVVYELALEPLYLLVKQLRDKEVLKFKFARPALPKFGGIKLPKLSLPKLTLPKVNVLAFLKTQLARLPKRRTSGESTGEVPINGTDVTTGTPVKASLLQSGAGK